MCFLLSRQIHINDTWKCWNLQAAKVGTSSSNSNSLHACARMAALEKNTLPNYSFPFGARPFFRGRKIASGRVSDKWSQPTNLIVKPKYSLIFICKNPFSAEHLITKKPWCKKTSLQKLRFLPRSNSLSLNLKHVGFDGFQRPNFSPLMATMDANSMTSMATWDLVLGLQISGQFCMIPPKEIPWVFVLSVLLKFTNSAQTPGIIGEFWENSQVFNIPQKSSSSTPVPKRVDRPMSVARTVQRCPELVEGYDSLIWDARKTDWEKRVQS